MNRPVLALAVMALLAGAACQKSADITPWLGEWVAEDVGGITIKGTARDLTIEEDDFGELATYNGYLDDKGIHFRRDNKEFLLERVKGSEIDEDDPLYYGNDNCVVVRETGKEDAYCREN